jgi:hypothetical protein
MTAICSHTASIGLTGLPEDWSWSYLDGVGSVVTGR